MKLISIVGARPQFIKAAPVGTELARHGHKNVLVHTGQHYDYKLSKIFFDELGIPDPDYNLEVGANTPVNQIAAMMRELAPILEKEKPDCAITYGDTNSTLAAAITLVKLGVPIVHIEGGERNFTTDLRIVHPSTIPEESNRVLVDRISEVIFCASARAVENLKHEGMERHVYFVGDVMLDTFSRMSQMAATRSDIMNQSGLKKGEYILVTVHRAINTDQPERLKAIIQGLCESDIPVIFPIHPRTQKVMNETGLMDAIAHSSKIKIINPVGYFDMLELEKNARTIVTDSGGVTREAYFAEVPSIIVDDTTAWIDLVNSGWSHLVGADAVKIGAAIRSNLVPSTHRSILGEANSSVLITEYLEKWHKSKTTSSHNG